MLNLLILFVLSKETNFFKTIVFLYSWKVEVFFMTILTQMRVFITFFFLLAQLHKSKKTISKKISYAPGFKQYLQNFLQNFGYEDVDKFDLFTNKN